MQCGVPDHKTPHTSFLGLNDEARSTMALLCGFVLLSNLALTAPTCAV